MYDGDPQAPINDHHNGNHGLGSSMGSISSSSNSGAGPVPEEARHDPGTILIRIIDFAQCITAEDVLPPGTLLHHHNIHRNPTWDTFEGCQLYSGTCV